MTDSGLHSWWESLRHSGLLLAPREVATLQASFGRDGLAERELLRLRRELTRFDSGQLGMPDWVVWLLSEVCGLDGTEGIWRRGPNVPADYSRRLVTRENLKPATVWTAKDGTELPVFMSETRVIGVGRGRKVVSDCVQWLRASGHPLALVTNGRQWRIVFAGLDFDAACESATDLWLQEGGEGAQLRGLRTLVQPALFRKDNDGDPPLLAAILASRRGQSELSAILGERVRQAVERLVQAHRPALTHAGLEAHGSDIYRAAVRVVMRIVVALFAEARDLLPRGEANYRDAYGIGGLFEDLQRAAVRGRSRLVHKHAAWPRVIGLFGLVYRGSHHPDLQVPAYGGELFAPGDAESPDPLLRALAVFESAWRDASLEPVPDSVVYGMLELLTRTQMRIRQGNTWVRTTQPVDFSDLSSEYIGILYEGLLDYELRAAPADDAVVFLAVGNEPALPLSRLEGMTAADLKALFASLKKARGGSDEAEDGEEINEAAEAEEGEAEDEETGEVGSDAETEGDGHDEEDEAESEDAMRTRARVWARDACIAAGLVATLRASATAAQREAHERELVAASSQLVRRLVLPGDWYLVRWGGTRKGSGTYYTRPPLAVPTVQRTLRPLAWNPPLDAEGSPDLLAPPDQWQVKPPPEILALKVCDPGCGSGSFPVAALRFLTDSLYVSLMTHGRLEEDWQRPLPALLGLASDEAGAALGSERLPCRPDADDFEPRVKAVLRRHVVERCIYGVDIDPLATELCRLALWIETMDRQLPFSFLDHKIKCGNSLIGAWFDTFPHYPAMAWSRDAGDKGHSNGVHFRKEAQTRALKEFRNERVKPDLELLLSGRDLLQPDLQAAAARTHDDMLRALTVLHELPVHDAGSRASTYREQFLGSESYRRLKSAMDLWCACWFWPADRLDIAPLPTALAEPTRQTLDVAEQLAAQHRFFHWELEFPDVFSGLRSGFDAVVGNPPWNVAKPNSKEFFSNVDPLYRSYGKQEALRRQTGYFAQESIERDWLDYAAAFKAFSSFVRYASEPFGDPEGSDKTADRFVVSRGKRNAILHDSWRKARSSGVSYADPLHPYRHQGSADTNLYKLFLEQAHALLREGGRLGFIVPSGLYSDHGTGDLRRLFIEHCSWEWLFGFENRDKIFDIHRSFKFNPVIIAKGGRTRQILTAFMRRRLEDWQEAERFATRYSAERIKRFSPKSQAILEIQSARDLEILEKIYANSVLLGDEGPDGWGVKYSREFDMTNDSKLFPPRPKWEANGYQPDEYSRWIKGNWRPIGELWAELGVKPLAEGELRCAQPPYDSLPLPRADIPEGIILSRSADGWIREDEIADIALPLYEGRMIGLLDFSKKGWVSGKGRSAVWREIDSEAKPIEPQYLMGTNDLIASGKSSAGPKIAYMRISSSTNSRTTIATYLCDRPAGDSVFFFVPANSSFADACAVSAILSSVPFDVVIRQRLGGLNMSEFLMVETPLPARNIGTEWAVKTVASRLTLNSAVFAWEWLTFLNRDIESAGWRESWAVTPHKRLEQTAALNALVAHWYGLSDEDIRHIIRDCGYPSAEIGGLSLNPKGFWRVDREMDPELRLTVLTLVAFRELQSRIRDRGGNADHAIAEFAGHGERSWRLPATIDLGSLELDAGQPTGSARRVADRLGPRNLDWQQVQDREESWRECRLHSRNLLGKRAYDEMMTAIRAGKFDMRADTQADGLRVREPQRLQQMLFREGE